MLWPAGTKELRRIYPVGGTLSSADKPAAAARQYQRSDARTLTAAMEAHAMPIASVFTNEFQAQLARSQYTRWVLDRGFSEENMLSLLCMIGVFDTYASRLLNPLFEDWANLRQFHRPICALEGLHQLARGERFNCEDWPRRLLTGRIALQFEDLPAPVGEALTKAFPAAKWLHILKIDEGFEVGGQTAEAQAIWVYVTPDGHIISQGPDRRRGETTKVAAFSAALIERIKSESRSRWATQRVCAEEHLRCIIWLAGEFVARTGGVFEHWKRSVLTQPELANGMVALEVMRCMVRFRERFEVAEFERRLERGRGHLALGDLPERIRSKLQAQFPERQWNYIWLIHGEYTALGEKESEQTVEVRVLPDGEVIVPG